jgi:amidase
MIDDYGALTVVLEIEGAAGGALAGKTFVVKENIDVARRVSTNGHPAWIETHAPAGANAPVVDRLLAAGARFVGKAQMDEMAYSLLGANPHFGTPRNPAAPGRHPGGSSSGSAVAVAAGLADFALGTDTAGSCRAPAAFCGVYGFRSSLGAISLNGVIPLAPSLDAIGWFARDIETMRLVGDALLPIDLARAPLKEAVLPTDTFAEVEEEFSKAAYPALEWLRRGGWREKTLGEDFWSAALLHFRNLQAFETWASHGAWIGAHRPQFGAGVKERFEIASRVTLEQRRAAEAFRDAARARVDDLFGDAGFLVVPTTPFRAPLLDDSAEELDAKRYRMMRVFLLASFFGLPQISVPLQADGAPVGLSLIGRRWSDRALIALTKKQVVSW